MFFRLELCSIPSASHSWWRPGSRYFQGERLSKPLIFRQPEGGCQTPASNRKIVSGIRAHPGQPRTVAKCECRTAKYGEERRWSEYVVFLSSRICIVRMSLSPDVFWIWPCAGQQQGTAGWFGTATAGSMQSKLPTAARRTRCSHNEEGTSKMVVASFTWSFAWESCTKSTLPETTTDTGPEQSVIVEDIDLSRKIFPRMEHSEMTEAAPFHVPVPDTRWRKFLPQPHQDERCAVRWENSYSSQAFWCRRGAESFLPHSPRDERPFVRRWPFNVLLRATSLLR